VGDGAGQAAPGARRCATAVRRRPRARDRDRRCGL